MKWKKNCFVTFSFPLLECNSELTSVYSITCKLTTYVQMEFILNINYKKVSLTHFNPMIHLYPQKTSENIFLTFPEGRVKKWNIELITESESNLIQNQPNPHQTLLKKHLCWTGCRPNHYLRHFCGITKWCTSFLKLFFLI